MDEEEKIVIEEEEDRQERQPKECRKNSSPKNDARDVVGWRKWRKKRDGRKNESEKNRQYSEIQAGKSMNSWNGYIAVVGGKTTFWNITRIIRKMSSIPQWWKQTILIWKTKETI